MTSDIRHHGAQLPPDNGRRDLTEVVLGESERLLSAPIEATADCVKDRGRLAILEVRRGRSGNG
ncbi:hypothetical protein PO587_33095 [Streptomyces gilvifuscus]|uniref:Uncharacterized protein n=1 Tax=Streptomyces gilvifuscus TaxID=1550617 RepID=A0ABT5G3K7_9ACTN|nr:hypothetical protein [Streptomyces gilvifuscus]MDC2959281.1 hypothetical protein [Streptomyces gilvifuscus]